MANFEEMSLKCNGISKEMEWDGKGMEMKLWDHTCGMSPMEFCKNFINSTRNCSSKFNSIPCNSAFYLKMPISGVCTNMSCTKTWCLKKML